MAQVGTPKFYISWGDWWRSIGIAVPRHQTISPHETSPVTLSSSSTWWNFLGATTVSEDYPVGINWVGVLNHDLNKDYKFIIKQQNASNNAQNSFNFTDTKVNYGDGEINYAGFSIGTTESLAWTNMNGGDVGIHTGGGTVSELPVDSDITFNIGCWLYGNYYDMSHAADLNLTLTRDYSNIKTIETKGGTSLSNDFGSSPPKWGERSAWQLGDQDFSTGGRRIWDLSFSFLSDSSVFPDNPTEISDGGGWEVDDTTPDFISEVVKKCNGGQLPFIFQPNTDENIFAICKFDQNSFNFQQTAPDLYSCKVRIREVW